MTPENKVKHDYLNRYKWDVIKLDEIEKEIIAVRLKALPGSPSFDGMPHGSGNNSDLSDYAAKLDDLLMDFKRIREKAIADIREISRAIEDIDSAKHSILLRYRYILLKDWETIGKEMGYTTDYVKGSLKGEALALFKIPDNS